MTSLAAKVIAIEQRADQYQVIVQITTKYRGSFNTLAFGEIKPYSGSLKDGRLGGVFPGSRLRSRGSIPSLDSALRDLNRSPAFAQGCGAAALSIWKFLSSWFRDRRTAFELR